MGKAAGTHCFVYTDLSGSSGLWADQPAAAESVMAELTELTTDLAKKCSGTIFKSLGDGHALVFTNPEDALSFATLLERSQADRPFKVRSAVHIGEAVPTVSDYQGAAMVVVARILELGTGSQILTSHELVLRAPGHEYVNRGSHHLRGLPGPQEVFQFVPPGSSPDFSPLRGSRRPTIPALTRPVHGRDRDIDRLVALVGSSDQRLVTVSGFGGVGKTTIAQVAANQVETTFRDGVVWVECEYVSTLEELGLAVSFALRTAWPDLPPDARWQDHLPGRHTLLVLDCCERMAANGVTPDQLLSACPSLKVLATSRIVFSSDFETEVHLHGLCDLSKKKPDLSPAVTLFESAGRQLDPTFQVTRSNISTVRRIVVRLETVPLAIILVASRLRYDSLATISALVESTVLEAAKTSRRKGRHASMTAVVQASFALLDDHDSCHVKDLSVFAGWFTKQDATAVLGVEVPVEQLADNSLVNVETQPGTARWRLLDPVREYARIEIDPGRWQTLLGLHASYTTQKAASLEQAVRDSDWKLLAKKLPDSLPDLRQALATAIETSDSRLLRQLASSLAIVYAESGLSQDLENLASHALDACERGVHDRLRASLLGLLAISSRRLGDLPRAKALLAQKLETALQVRDTSLIADTVGDALDLALLQQDKAEAKRLLAFWPGEYVSNRPSDNQEQMLLRARCHFWLGEKKEGHRLLTNVLDTIPGRDPINSSFYVMYSCAEINRAAGDHDEAARIAAHMLRKAVEGNTLPFVFQALRQIGLTHIARNDTANLAPVVRALESLPASSVRSARELATEWRTLTGPLPTSESDQPGMPWKQACFACLPQTL